MKQRLKIGINNHSEWQCHQQCNNGKQYINNNKNKSTKNQQSHHYHHHHQQPAAENVMQLVNWYVHM